MTYTTICTCSCAGASASGCTRQSGQRTCTPTAASPRSTPMAASSTPARRASGMCSCVQSDRGKQLAKGFFAVSHQACACCERVLHSCGTAIPSHLPPETHHLHLLQIGRGRRGRKRRGGGGRVARPMRSRGGGRCSSGRCAARREGKALSNARRLANLTEPPQQGKLCARASLCRFVWKHELRIASRGT